MGEGSGISVSVSQIDYRPRSPNYTAQGKTLDELNKNLQEVIALLLEDGKTAKSS